MMQETAVAAAVSGGRLPRRPPPAAAAATEAAAARARHVCAQLAHDRLVALTMPWLCLPVMWHAIPRLTLTDNLQWMATVAATLLAFLAWPTLHRRSYERWRTPVVSAIRMWQLSQPLAHSVDRMNANAPGDDPVLLLRNLLHLAMGACGAMRLRRSLPDCLLTQCCWSSCFSQL